MGKCYSLFKLTYLFELHPWELLPPLGYHCLSNFLENRCLAVYFII